MSDYEPETKKFFQNVMAVADKWHAIPEMPVELDPGETLANAVKRIHSPLPHSPPHVRRRVKLASPSPEPEVVAARLRERTESPEPAGATKKVVEEKVLIESAPNSPRSPVSVQQDEDDEGSDYGDDVCPDVELIYGKVSDELKEQVARYNFLNGIVTAVQEEEVVAEEEEEEEDEQDEQDESSDDEYVPGESDEEEEEEEETPDEVAAPTEPGMSEEEKKAESDILAQKLIESLSMEIMHAYRNPQEGVGHKWSFVAIVDKYPYEIILNSLQTYYHTMLEEFHEDHRDHLSHFFTKTLKLVRDTLDAEADARVAYAIENDSKTLVNCANIIGEHISKQLACPGESAESIAKTGESIGKEIAEKMKTIMRRNKKPKSSRKKAPKAKSSRKQAAPRRRSGQ